MIQSCLHAEEMIPYDVEFLVGNIAGCGDVTTSQLFFTREGGMYELPSLHPLLLLNSDLKFYSSSNQSST